MSNQQVVCAAILLLLSLEADADTLGELRTRLERFPARAPVTGTATVHVKGGADDLGSRDGRAAFKLEAGPGGFAVRVRPETLERAEREAADKKRNPDAPTPTRTAMVAMTIFEILDSVDMASMILGDLSGATLLESTPATRLGKPATLLRIKVRGTLAGTRRKFVDEPQIELRLWLGSDGVPLAAERDSTFAASFLFVKAANVRKERWDLAVHGDRLHALRNEELDRVSAGGKSVESSRSVSYSLD